MAYGPSVRLLVTLWTAGLVARDCWSHEGSRHHHDNQRKATFSLRSVAAFMLGYAGIAQCEYRRWNRVARSRFQRLPK